MKTLEEMKKNKTSQYFAIQNAKWNKRDKVHPFAREVEKGVVIY